MRNSKREPVLTIPPVVRLVVVRVEPLPIVVTVRVEQVRIAIGLRERSSVPPPLEFSQGCILFGISFSRMTYWVNAPNFSRQVSSFLRSTCTTLSETVIADTLDARILVSVAESRDRPHIHLLPWLLYIFVKK